MVGSLPMSFFSIPGLAKYWTVVLLPRFVNCSILILSTIYPLSCNILSAALSFSLEQPISSSTPLPTSITPFALTSFSNCAAMLKFLLADSLEPSLSKPLTVDSPATPISLAIASNPIPLALRVLALEILHALSPAESTDNLLLNSEDVIPLAS